jgi:hypothetical protein
LFLHFPLVLMRFTPSRSAVVLFLLFVSMCVVVVVESGVYCSDYQFFWRWWSAVCGDVNWSYASAAFMLEADVVLAAWWFWWRRIWRRCGC